VTYVNGREVSRRTLEQTIQKNAVDELIAVGIGQPAEAISADSNDLPIIGDGYILLPTGEMLTYTDTAQVRATAYTHTDAGCDFVTATGSTVHMGTVAVDPRYIPYGTRMFIIANDGSYVYGISEAEDCGGAIKGDRVDLYFPTYAECMEFGWRKCTIYFLG
jgi:3D (Asp-Asp-Asp) domain-containing protein